MAFSRLLIVGQNPAKPKKSKSITITRVEQWTKRLKEDNWSFMNCSDEVGNNYTIDYERLLSEATKYDRVIALGNVASKALTKVGVDHFKMPHPSGLNRQMNDPAFVDRKIEECYNYLT